MWDTSLIRYLLFLLVIPVSYCDTCCFLLVETICTSFLLHFLMFVRKEGLNLVWESILRKPLLEHLPALTGSRPNDSHQWLPSHKSSVPVLCAEVTWHIENQWDAQSRNTFIMTNEDTLVSFVAATGNRTEFLGLKTIALPTELSNNCVFTYCIVYLKVHV